MGKRLWVERNKDGSWRQHEAGQLNPAQPGCSVAWNGLAVFCMMGAAKGIFATFP